MPRYWVIAPYMAERPEEWERVWRFDLHNRIISIGWSSLGDIAKYDKKQLKAQVDRDYDGERPGNRTNYFKILWSFYHDIQQGDIVIARKGRKIIAAVGTVTRTAYHNRKKTANVQVEYHFPNHIGVRWHDVPRNKVFDQIVFGMQTLYGISKDKYRELVGLDNGEHPMSWWIYKCNSGQHEYQKDWGDWDDFFNEDYSGSWGSTQNVPSLAELKKGDMVIAYQTNRNELVGIAKVRQSCERDTHLYLTPIETIRVKVRPLKKSNPKIAAIPALQRGPIKTVYEILAHDARRLLEAARAAYKFSAESTPKAKDISEPPDKVQFTTYRILRDTALAREIKELHRYRCQVCHSEALELADGRLYAEAHHIKPLGSPYGGFDIRENILCVCPNCHVLLDYGAIPLDASKLGRCPSHKVEQEYVEYHNTYIFRKKVA